MKAFIHIGLNPYQMLEVSEAEMDKLLKTGDRFDWPFRFDKRKRVWPTPPAKTEVFFYD
jgi:hypothetical protein